MYNILQGQGKAALITDISIKIIKAWDNGEVVIMRDIIIALCDTYLEHGVFENASQRHEFDYRSWAGYPIWWEDEVKTPFEYYKKLEGLKSWSPIKKRHLIYIPFGIIYEERIRMANPEWSRTNGRADYYGKIDFIDPANKKIITVKATKWVDSKKLENQIKDWAKDTWYSDYEIILVHLNTKNWEAYSGPIQGHRKSKAGGNNN